MAIKTFADIYTAKTQDQLIAEVLARLPAGWPVTDYKPGGLELTRVQLDTYLTADLYALGAKILAGGYLDTAEGDWLTVLAIAVFQEERSPALATRGHAVLTMAVGAAPQTIQPGQLWLQDANGVRFSNLTGGVCAAGSPLTVQVQAEFAGVIGNIPTGTMTELGTPLPGMTCNNPVYPAIGGTTWISDWGANVASDAELKKLCRAKWGTLGTGGPPAAYYYWARKAAAQVKKVKVFQNYLAGRAWAGGITVYLAGDAGPVAQGIVDTVRVYIAERLTAPARLNVESAVGLVIPVSGPMKISPQATAADVTAAKARLDGYAAILDIGELVYRSEVVGALVYPPGGLIRDFKPTAPVGDKQPNRNQVVSFDSSGIVTSV